SRPLPQRARYRLRRPRPLAGRGRRGCDHAEGAGARPPPGPGEDHAREPALPDRRDGSPRGRGCRLHLVPRLAPLAGAKHVVVCGAGVMGAAVAYFLADRGVAVTVVERSAVACAASGKSGGFLALDWCDGSELGPLARASFALHAELARRLGTDY